MIPTYHIYIPIKQFVDLANFRSRFKGQTTIEICPDYLLYGLCGYIIWFVFCFFFFKYIISVLVHKTWKIFIQRWKNSENSMHIFMKCERKMEEKRENVRHRREVKHEGRIDYKKKEEKKKRLRIWPHQFLNSTVIWRCFVASRRLTILFDILML